MEGLEELALLDQLDIYFKVLRKRLLRGLLTLPEAAMMDYLNEWLQYAAFMLRRAA